MTTGVDRLNRVVLTMVGLVLSVSAVGGLALGMGAFGAQDARRSLLEPEVSGYVDRTPWFWWGVAVGCVIVVVLALSWMLAQVRTDRIRRVELAAGDPDRATVVHAGAVTEAVEQEVGSYVGVTSASARLRGLRARRLDLIVGVSPAADLTELSDRLQQQTAVNLRRVLDTQDLPVHVQLKPAPEPARGSIDVLPALKGQASAQDVR
jgi:hypothetical protein